MAIRNINFNGIDWQDTGENTLDGGINDSVTTITVGSTASFKTAGYVYIDSELISYAGKNATQFTTAVRGLGVNGAASHLTSASVYEKEVFLVDDVNDTFNAAFNKIQTISTFWLNSDIYEVYDDFESYGTGNMATNTNWTVTLSGTGTHTSVVTTSTTAGGSGDELVLTASTTSSSDTTATILSKILSANRHTFVRVFSTCTSNSTGSSQSTRVQFGNDGNWHTIFSLPNNDSGSSVNCIHVVNTGDGDYTLYIGGKAYATYTGISDANAQIQLGAIANDGGGAGTSTAILYLDDVRQSGFDVN